MDLRIWHLATLELLLLQPRQEMKNLRIINSTGIFHPAFKVRKKMIYSTRYLFKGGGEMGSMYALSYPVHWYVHI